MCPGERGSHPQISTSMLEAGLPQAHEDHTSTAVSKLLVCFCSEVQVYSGAGFFKQAHAEKA